MNRSIEIIAHRGARAFAPENTLEAIDKAAQLGAGMVELDVQLSSDSQLVVLHDDTLDRCSNALDMFPGRDDYRVSSFTLSEIRSLDAGTWFVRELSLAPLDRQPFLRSLSDLEQEKYISQEEIRHYASGRVRHPTLEEALARCRDHRLRVNVELKASEAQPRVSRTLSLGAVELIRAMGLISDVLVSSFDHTSLEHVKQLEPRLKTGVLVVESPTEPVEYCRRLGAASYHPGCVPGMDAVGFATDEFRTSGRLPIEPFRSLRAAGIAVYVWTANDRARIQNLIEAGVDGIFTDYPNRVRDLLYASRTSGLESGN